MEDIDYLEVPRKVLRGARSLEDLSAMSSHWLMKDAESRISTYGPRTKSCLGDVLELSCSEVVILRAQPQGESNGWTQRVVIQGFATLEAAEWLPELVDDTNLVYSEMHPQKPVERYEHLTDLVVMKNVEGGEEVRWGMLRYDYFNFRRKLVNELPEMVSFSLPCMY